MPSSPTCRLPNWSEAFVWLLRPFELDPTTALDLLSPDERDRAGRFRQDEDRTRYTITRARLRVLLGRCLERPPASISFDYGPFGKPSLADNPGSLHFSLAHSGRFALIALARDARLGVDIEDLQIDRDLTTLSEAVLTRAEHQQWITLPTDARKKALLQAWTRREAVGKALGIGIGPNMPAIDEVEGDSNQLFLTNLEAAPDSVAAIATGFANPHINLMPYNA